MKNICGRTTPVSPPLIVVTVELLLKRLSKLESWWLSQRLHLHADEASQFYPIACTNHRVILPISSNWGQVFHPDFLALWANRTKPFLQGEEITPSGVTNHSGLGSHKRITILSRRRTCSLPLPRSKLALYLASPLDFLSRLFLWPTDLSSRISPWTKGSASTQRGCAVLTGVERRLSVCSPPGSAGTLWPVPLTGLSNHRRRKRTSEPLTLG